MSLNETKEIMQNIKAHYQTFSIENYVFEEWYKVLKEYDFDDVMEKLVDHLTSNEHKEIPKVYQLVKYLSTTTEKQNQKEIDSSFKVCCNLCDRWMTMSEYENHYGRCLDIEYLVSKSKKIGKPTTRAELSKLTQTQIQALYEKYKPEKIEFKGIVRI